jgi:hypothetical protein
MSRKEDEQYKRWIEAGEAKLAGAELEAFKAFSQTEFARDVFRGSLRTEDYYTRLNDITAQERQLKDDAAELAKWYEEEAPKNEALIAERDALRAQLETLGSGNAPAASGTDLGISSQDLAELRAKVNKVDVLDKMLPSVLGDVAAFTHDAIKNGFNVDPREVIRLSLQQGIEPYRAYESLTADERRKRYEKAQEDEKQKWIAEGRRQALTNSPDHIQPTANVVSYLNSLNDAANKAPSSGDRVSAAMKEFVEGNF